MTSRLMKMLKMYADYPGFTFARESWALRTYLEHLEQYIKDAQIQYRATAMSKLDSEEFSWDEKNHELSDIDDIVEIQIPRFLRIGAIVPIWGLFESSVSDILDWCTKREGLSLHLSDIRGGSFCKRVEKYLRNVFRIELPWSTDDYARLVKLQQVRHKIAHRNGSLADESPERQRKFEKTIADIEGVEIVDHLLVISAKYIQGSAELAEAAVRELSELMGDRFAYKED